MGFSIVSYGLHTLIIWISYTGHMNFIYPAYGFHILFIGFSYCWHTSGIPEPCLRYSGGITQAYGLHTLLIRFSYENHMGTIHESYGKHTCSRFNQWLSGVVNTPHSPWSLLFSQTVFLILRSGPDTGWPNMRPSLCGDWSQIQSGQKVGFPPL